MTRSQMFCKIAHKSRRLVYNCSNISGVKNEKMVMGDGNFGGIIDYRGVFAGAVCVAEYGFVGIAGAGAF